MDPILPAHIVYDFDIGFPYCLDKSLQAGLVGKAQYLDVSKHGMVSIRERYIVFSSDLGVIAFALLICDIGWNL